MVLNATLFGGGESRGQMILSSAVVLSLIILSAVVIVNGSFLASVDKAEGVEKSTPESLNVVKDSEHMVHSVLVRTNRDAPTDFSDSFSQQASLFAQNAEYNGLIVDMSIEKKVSGDRVYGRFDPTTGSHSEGTIVTGLDSDASGSVVVDTGRGELPTSQSNAFKIEYGPNTLELYNTSTATATQLTVDITANGDSGTYVLNNETDRVAIDLGVGKVDGMGLSEYNMSADGSVEINNSRSGSNQIYWTGEFVTPGSASPQVSNFAVDTNALYGVGYNIEIQSQRSSIQTDRFVTHGPIPQRN